MSNNINENNKLKVIKGGLSDSFHYSRKVFDSAYVTDTRLMGVIGMGIKWNLPDNNLRNEFHQFFYLDAEEFGLDTYTSLLGGTEEEIQRTENDLIGGLGAKKVDITLREAMFLVQHYAKFNKDHGFEIPTDMPDFRYLLKESILLSEAEQQALMTKQCVKVRSEYEAINYYLMRSFGKDFTAAKFLLAENPRFAIKINPADEPFAEGDFPEKPGDPMDLFPELEAATLIINTIDPDKTPGSFICESLVEFDDTYHIIITHVQMEALRVKTVTRVSMFQITSTEAAMMVCKPEYVSEYIRVPGNDDLDIGKLPLLKKAVVTDHDKGKLYMLFHDNNNHVNNRVYRLNDDVEGIVFTTEEGLLLSAAYNNAEIDKIDSGLGAQLKDQIILLTKYEFKEPIVFDFIQSDFDDFELFVETYGDEE